jgi:hypothetical protein
MGSKRHRRTFTYTASASLLGGALLSGWIIHGTPARGDAANAAQVSAAAQDQAQVSTVEDVFTKAVSTMQSVGSPSQDYKNAALAASNRGPSPVLDDQQANQLLVNGQKALARYFAPGLAKQKEVGLKNMIDMARDPNQVNLGAGISKVVFREVTVSGATATVQADVTAWAASRVRQAPGAPWIDTHPESTMRFVGELTQSAEGAWMVSVLKGDYVEVPAG